MIEPIVDCQKFAPLEQNSFDEGNSRAAAENAAMSNGEATTLLRGPSATAAAYLPSRSDDELDRTPSMPAFGADLVTARQVIEGVLIGRPLDHGASLGQGLGDSAHSHQVQGVLA